MYTHSHTLDRALYTRKRDTDIWDRTRCLQACGRTTPRVRAKSRGCTDRRTVVWFGSGCSGGVGPLVLPPAAHTYYPPDCACVARWWALIVHRHRLRLYQGMYYRVIHNIADGVVVFTGTSNFSQKMSKYINRSYVQETMKFILDVFIVDGLIILLWHFFSTIHFCTSGRFKNIVQ